MVKLICRTFLIFSIFFVLMFTASVSNVLALEPTAEIYPSEGTVYTDIFLQVRGLDKYVEGEFAPAAVGLELYVFWDDKIIIERQGDIMSGSYHLHIFDAHFSPPDEYPYSELGNHTIVAEVWKSSQFCCNFTLTFEIVEYYPSPEFQALYNELLADYDTLNTTYHILQSNYTNLESNHTELQESHDSLQTNYENLQTAYNTLLSYENLKEKYDSLQVELGNIRNLMYIFVMATIVFIATTVYFATRKPKTMPTSISEI